MMSIAHRKRLTCETLCEILKAIAPYETGNLAINAIRVIETSPGEFAVAIGGEIAPYARYTQEKWVNGVNPNEGWINRGIEAALPLIRQIMSGAVTEDDVSAYMETAGYTKSLRDKQVSRAQHLERKANKLAS